MLTLLLSLQLAVAAPVDTGVPLANETQKLEHLLKQEKLDDASRKRLAEIYFLTSRCLEAHDLLYGKIDLQTDVYAACGGFNEQTPANVLDSKLGKVVRFKAALEKSTDSPEVTALWNELKERPDAKYLMLKAMRAKMAAGFDPSKQQLAQMNEWEKSLRALEK